MVCSLVSSWALRQAMKSVCRALELGWAGLGLHTIQPDAGNLGSPLLAPAAAVFTLLLG